MKGDAYRLIRACSSSLEEAAALLDAEPFLNVRIAFEETPLHVAADHGRLAIAESLLQHCADPTARHAQGRTPAEEASHRGFTELARLLAEAERSHQTG
jgi:ankyrin repeat protein